MVGIQIFRICTPASGESTTTMSWIVRRLLGQPDGSATAPQYLKMSLKYLMRVEDLQQGVEPRLCGVSVAGYGGVSIHGW
jgi:hypothetical protein